MNGQPLVTIGLPTYNRSSTLERTLDSLINQTYRNIEIIISDNGSDVLEVENIIKKYMAIDSRISYYRHPVNMGPIGNINSILDRVTGEYFMRISDDDWLDAHYVESCLNFLIQNPDYSCAYGPSKIYNSNGDFVFDDVEIDMIQASPQERVKQYIGNVYKNGTFYGLVRKEYVQYLRMPYILAFDWIVMARIAFSGKFKMLENVHTYITEGGASQTIDSIILVCRLPKLTYFFPFLTASFGIFNDILWKSSAYKKISFFKRVSFGLDAFKIVANRTGANNELKPGLKKLIKSVTGLKRNPFNALKSVMLK